MVTILNELELALKEYLENLGIVDDVVVDFNEELRGDSVLVVSVDRLEAVEPAVNHKGAVVIFTVRLLGIWKVNEDIDDVIDARNDAVNSLTLALITHDRVNGGVLRLKNWRKNIWQDKFDDTRFYVAFEAELSYEKFVR